MTITVTDLFCGAGGSGLGATAVPGVELYLAANHWTLAVETHQANFPDCRHDVADISQVNPRRYNRTDILWASPECTNHSGAKGIARTTQGQQPDLFGETLPTEASERSRATMWDVPRFAEHHDYRFVIVENVVEALKWVLWPAWLQAMKCLGYQHKTVFLNSMHAPGIAAPRAPQSRDRLYVVFWKPGDKTPDLAPRPLAWCARCDTNVRAVQAWKRFDATWGRYKSQYVYRCPDIACRGAEVEPYADPASSAIDWALPGQRIGDRVRPLKPATMARIQAGLDRYAKPVTMVVPVEGRDGKTVRTTDEPMRTMTARSETGVAFIAELRGGGSRGKARAVTDPLATVTASGQHHMLVRNNSSKGLGGEMCTPATEPVRTITTAGHQSLVGWSERPPVVDDCTFRMLEPKEIGAAMAFRSDYQVLGNKRERVRQYGNAVTPPASEWIFRTLMHSIGELDGDVVPEP